MMEMHLRDKETNTSSDGQDERLGHDPDEPLPETDEGEEEEDPPEHGALARWLQVVKARAPGTKCAHGMWWWWCLWRDNIPFQENG